MIKMHPSTEWVKNTYFLDIVNMFPLSEYRVDDEVSWACDEGFEAKGLKKAVCLESGRWSTDAPQCRRVSCGPPSLPDNAAVDAVAFVYGSTANYTCRDGYVMEVSLLLTIRVAFILSLHFLSLSLSLCISLSIYCA